MKLINLDANCELEYTNGGVSTTRNEPSSGNHLHTDLGKTIRSPLTPTTALRGYTLIRWSRANWMSFDAN